MKPTEIKLAIIEDHCLLRKGMASLLQSVENFNVILEAENGLSLQSKLNKDCLPHIALVDINMPIMNGFQTTSWLYRNYPEIKVLAVSMNDDETTICKIIGMGARGFINKDANPIDIIEAIHQLVEKGFFTNEQINSYLFKKIQGTVEEVFDNNHLLSDKELHFMQLCCSDKVYKQIAADMGIPQKTVENIRERVFNKLGVKSRTMVALHAINSGLINMQEIGFEYPLKKSFSQ